MSLRPRYSLLTLLVLTALVAGGVKLWRGPHHVVERRAPGKELEYSYCRDWDGTKIVDGLCTIRFQEPNGSLQFLYLTYFRQGQQLPCHYKLMKSQASKPYLNSIKIEDEDFANLPLQAEERWPFQQAVKKVREQKKDLAAGLQWIEELADDRWLLQDKTPRFADMEEFYEEMRKIQF